MCNPLCSEFVRLFRIRSDLLVCVGAAVALAALRRPPLVVGVLTGLCLFILNAFLLYRAGRSVLRAASRGRGAALAGLTSAVRIMILAGVLVLMARQGVPAFLSSAGSLLFCQGNLHLGHIRGKGRARWMNT